MTDGTSPSQLGLQDDNENGKQTLTENDGSKFLMIVDLPYHYWPASLSQLLLPETLLIKNQRTISKTK